MTQPAPRPRDASQSTRDIVVGATVYGADNGRFGQVAGSYRNFLIVERGFFMPVDYYVPMSAIGRVDGDLVVLSVSRDAALTQGWERPPFTSETGQRGVRRPAVGRASAPVERHGVPPATSPPNAAAAAAAAAAPTSWPSTSPRTAEPPVPSIGGDPGITPPPADSGTGEATGQSASQPDVAPAGAGSATSTARSAAVPGTGPFADTYAIGTNTESYHAMTGFPADPTPQAPDGGDPVATPAPETASVATPPAGPETAAATPPAGRETAATRPASGEDAGPVDVADATPGSGSDQSVPMASGASPPAADEAEPDGSPAAERPAP